MDAYQVCLTGTKTSSMFSENVYSILVPLINIGMIQDAICGHPNLMVLSHVCVWPSYRNFPRSIV